MEVKIAQKVFKRYEKKYLLTTAQADALQAVLALHTQPDDYGTYWVQNLYFDTDDWDVVRTSIEKPLYKEKMRLRCYGVPDERGSVFLELKKKYDGIVYKRRVTLPVHVVTNPNEFPLVETLLSHTDTHTKKPEQIARELGFYLRQNPVKPKMFLAYQRIALVGTEDANLRITMDSAVRYRLDGLHFDDPEGGSPILSPDRCLMEIKAPLSMPLWLTSALGRLGIFGHSFSKYGTCYKDFTANFTTNINREREPFVCSTLPILQEA